MALDIQIGDEVLVGSLFYKVKKISEENVKTLRKGTLTFYKLYLDAHTPVYSHSVSVYRREGVEYERKKDNK